MMYKLKQDYIQINKYSRPGKMLEDVKGIVIHWTANPGVSAQKNRDYFNNLPHLKNPRYASAQEFIDEKHIIQAIPLTEVAYHISHHDTLQTHPEMEAKFGIPNLNFIGLEVVPINDKGVMHINTFKNLMYRSYHLLKFYNLNTDRLFLHHDFTGKKCHKYFVENPIAWKEFKNRIQSWLDNKKLRSKEKNN